MSTAHGPHISMRTYITVFIALMVLLAVTVLAAMVHLGEISFLIAMTIAAIKAALVVLYFMHVRFASGLTKIFVAAAFVWMGILFLFLFADFFTRDWTHMSRGWNEQVKAHLAAPASEAEAPAAPHGE